MWKTEGNGKNARPFNTKTGAHTMREHREILRAQAEGRNSETPVDKRRCNRPLNRREDLRNVRPADWHENLPPRLQG